MSEWVLASLLMTLGVVSCLMVWSQNRERHGKRSLPDSVLNWIAKHVA
ncbi:hypothetical protein KGQ90_03940 [Modicisalibacter tunisiensis]|nr:hypothetical protein [Modicisalibacter tunisiensis]MBZ9538095.1 hypothetical protein [Modicisalibacter tunisiensis]